uniref:Uncharacterized protein n=1 Tax=Oryza barthii TaxID=65489 RepID=A0A0D3HAQ0_9ORYZ
MNVSEMNRAGRERTSTEQSHQELREDELKWPADGWGGGRQGKAGEEEGIGGQQRDDRRRLGGGGDAGKGLSQRVWWRALRLKWATDLEVACIVEEEILRLDAAIVHATRVVVPDIKDKLPKVVLREVLCHAAGRVEQGEQLVASGEVEDEVDLVAVVQPGENGRLPLDGYGMEILAAAEAMAGVGE